MRDEGKEEVKRKGGRRIISRKETYQIVSPHPPL